MKIISISDMHLDGHKSSVKLFDDFSIRVSDEKPDVIIFLGDTFDLMVGNCREYFGLYHYFFNTLSFWLQKGIKVFYCEGNHDFHLKKLFHNFLVEWKLAEVNLRYITKPEILLLSASKSSIIFTHGDRHETKSFSAKIYECIIRSSFTAVLAQYLVTFKLIEKVADLIKGKSQSIKRSQVYDQDHEREKFRLIASQIAKNNMSKDHNLQLVLLGHSHIIDQVTLTEGVNYLNNGYPFRDRSYCLIHCRNDKTTAKIYQF